MDHEITDSQIITAISEYLTRNMSTWSQLADEFSSRQLGFESRWGCHLASVGYIGNNDVTDFFIPLLFPCFCNEF